MIDWREMAKLIDKYIRDIELEEMRDLSDGEKIVIGVSLVLTKMGNKTTCC